MTLRNYSNNSTPIPLSVDVDENATTLPVSSTASMPEPPFTLTMERLSDDEEFCLCTDLDPTSLEVVRGYDDTLAVPHAATTPIEHTVGAIDYREANFHINDQSHDQHTQYLRKALLTTKGDLYVATGAGTIVRVGVGDDGSALLADASTTPGVRWGSAFPVGSLLMYAGATAPDGWLLANGSVRTFGVGGTDDPLYQIIGSTFNTGGESGNQFRLPDLRGRMAIGAGQGSGLTNRVRGARGGAESVVLSEANIAAHDHSLNNHHHAWSNNHAHAIDGDYGLRIGVTVPTAAGWLVTTAAPNRSQAISFSDVDSESIGGNTSNATGNTGAAGSGTAHENMSPFVVVNYLIKR